MYSFHIVSVHNRSSGRTWRLRRGHIWHTGVVFSHRNWWGCNHVAVRITSWDRSEGGTQDISKVWHHEQQGKTALICSNTAGVVCPTMQRITVIQEVGEVYWVIWVPYQSIRPMCVKQDDKWQTDEGSMSRGWLKGVTYQQLWNHQVWRISVKQLLVTNSAQA